MITLKEFFGTSKLMGIHCRTIEEALTIFKKFNELGKTWQSGDKYEASDLTKDSWQFSIFGSGSTPVYYNNGTYGTYGYALERHFPTYVISEITDLDTKFDDYIKENNLEWVSNLIPSV